MGPFIFEEECPVETKPSNNSIIMSIYRELERIEIDLMILNNSGEKYRPVILLGAEERYALGAMDWNKDVLQKMLGYEVVRVEQWNCVKVLIAPVLEVPDET